MGQLESRNIKNSYLCVAMKDSEDNIRIKVVSGYVLVALLTLAAMWWVYATVVSIATTPRDEQGHIYEKSALTSSVISYLYQVDYYGNRLTQSYSNKALSEYKGALATLYANLDSLKTKIVSEPQGELIDKLQVLLSKKDKNTLELAKLRLDVARDDFYERSIEEVIRHSAQDSVEYLVVTSTAHNDTIKSVKPKRTFFQRIGDVFSPKKSAQQSQEVVVSLKTDTLRAKQVPSDSITLALQRAKEDISENRSRIKQTLASKLTKLIATEREISTQISLIITELNREATQSSLDEMKAKHSALASSGRVIAIVAVVAVLIIALFLFFILKDIRRSTRYKRALERARIHAEELMRSRHRMLLNISHDIKAPLCSITGYLDLMRSSSDTEVRKWSESMKISAGYIMDLLTNLLEYARLESGKSVSYISAFDLDLLIDELVKIFAPMANDKGIALQVGQEAPVGFISSDAIRIRQIVMNLLSNAVKFTDQGGIEISYSLVARDWLVISVKDSGHGIAESKINAVFDEFTRVENGEGVEGSGLGLAVVRGAVSLLGGTISVQSKERRGSVFTVSIPIKKTDAKSESVPVRIEPQRILIVDDDVLQLKMMTEMIVRSGHTLHCTSKLKEAIQIVTTKKIDLVLTDLQMGAFSGYKLLQAIRTKGCRMPVVAVSASERTDREELKKAGFDDFLRKPFSLAGLNAIIARSVLPAEIPSIQELMGGDEEAVREIMGLFATSSVENIVLLRKHLDNGQPEQARRVCHKMLPMFQQLGFMQITQLLKEVDGGDFDAAKIRLIASLVEELTTQCRTL